MFKLGDEVYSKEFGKGIITNIFEGNHYPIGVKFRYFSYIIWFTLSGKYSVFENNLNRDITKVEKPMQVTRSEVFSELARVSKMIEGTDLQLHHVAKYRGVPLQHLGGADTWLTDQFTFALAIVEGKPVFTGDTLWGSNLGAEVTIMGLDIPRGYLIDSKGNYVRTNLTWKQPKRTFLLNGEELPLPDSKQPTVGKLYWFDALFIKEIQEFQWNSAEDREQVQTAILKLLNGE